MKITHSAGFTLVEILVSLSLLSILLLSLAAFHLYLSKQHLNTYHAHLAQRQLKNMEERLHMLNGQEGYEEQENAWNQENKELLPILKGEVKGAYPDYFIKLCWGRQGEESQESATKCLSENFVLNC